MIPSRLQRYVLLELLRVAFISALALTCIVFVGTSLSLVHRGLSVTQIPGLVRYIFAFSLPYALPSALLVASVFVFGRMSGQNELIAISSSGVNLNHVILPPVFVALLLMAGTFELNHYVLPRAHDEVKRRTEEMIDLALKSVGSLQPAYKLGDFHIYVGRVDQQKGTWRNVAVIEFTEDDFPSQIMIADEASCRVDREKNVALLHLRDGMRMTPKLGDLPSISGQTALSFGDMSVTVSLERRSSSRPKYLALDELCVRMEELRERDREIRNSQPELADVKHPKTERAAVERKMDAAWRDCRELKAVTDSHVSAVEDARGDVEKAREKRHIAKSARDQAEESCTRLRERYETRKSLVDELRAQIAHLNESDADPDEVAERRRLFTTEKAAVDRIAGALKTAEDKLKAAEAALSEVQVELDARNEVLDEATSVYEVAKGKSDVAAQTYAKCRELYLDVKDLESLLRAETVYHDRNAGAASGLIFVLIGVPLGIIARRGNVIIAFALSFFAVLLIYYPLMMVGRMLSVDGYLTPMIAQWMANLVVGGIGLYLLCRVIRR